MKPIIGIPLRYQKSDEGRSILYISEKARRTIQQAGGFVYPIAPVQNVDYYYTRGNDFAPLTDEEKRDISKVLDICDGVMFPGGVKFTPYDRYLLEVVIERNIPVLGICLGMQMMSCYQDDINLGDVGDDIKHNQKSDSEFAHIVNINKNSKLYKIIGKEEIRVNSFHQHCVKKSAIYKVNATSEDGIIEGIEYPGDQFNIGVQWHPEISYEFDDDSRKIIDAFIDASKCRMYEKSCNINGAKIRQR